MARSNFDGLKQLQEQMEALANPQTQKQFYEGCLKECAARFLGKVIRKTPVGNNLYVDEDLGNGRTRQTVARQGGTLRRGWTAKTEAEAESGRSTNPTQYANSLRVERTGRNYSITITNPVHYASYVESGHRQQVGRYVPAIGKRLKKSWVEGQFFMAKSEAEVKAEIPAVLQRRFNQFLKGRGNQR